jgi:two-component system cell cycle response regulator
MNDIDAPASENASELQQRVADLEQQHEHLMATVEILEEISGTLHFVDILQRITRKLGELYGLDRCSIFLSERRGTTARLVASYEDPSIRNYIVDLERYPELKRALQSGQTVFIPDGTTDPDLKHIRSVLEQRGAKTISVIPLAWRGVVIGAMFLRTFREGQAFSDADIRFLQTIAHLTAKVLRNAFKYERLAQRQAETSELARRANLERVALVGFLKRLLNAFSKYDGAGAEGLLSESAGEELDRLAEVAMTVLHEEGKGR